MFLVSLDKKLVIVRHKMTAAELLQVKVPKEEFEKIVKNEIYNKGCEMLFRRTKVKQINNAEGVTWEFDQYILTEIEMYNLLREVCELSEEDRLRLIKDCDQKMGSVRI